MPNNDPAAAAVDAVPVEEKRAPDQDAAIEQAFVEAKLPEEDRRAQPEQPTATPAAAAHWEKLARPNYARLTNTPSEIVAALLELNERTK